MFLEIEVLAQGRREWVEPPSATEDIHALNNSSSNGSGSGSGSSSGYAKAQAAILAMGRATPPNKITQSTYTDWYFKVTGCEEKVELKQKMQRICKFVLFP